MAAFVNVFIRTDTSLSAITPQISNALGVTLVPDRSDVGHRYYADLPDVRVVAFDEHGLEVDRDMDFPQYAVQLDLGPLTGEQSHDDRVRDTAISLAKQISANMGTATMVTWDLQRVLERCGS